MQRDFTATRPNQRCESDRTYVATWRGVVYVDVVPDAFSRRIVGWRAAPSLRTDLALDALEQARYDRDTDAPLVHHRDRGPHDLAIRYTDRLLEAGMESSVRSRGDACDKGLAETINGLYQPAVIHHLGPWKGLEDVEYATLSWSRGTIRSVCWNRWATSRRRSTRSRITGSRRRTRPWHSTYRASGNPGAIQLSVSSR